MAWNLKRMFSSSTPPAEKGSETRRADYPAYRLQQAQKSGTPQSPICRRKSKNPFDPQSQNSVRQAASGDKNHAQAFGRYKLSSAATWASLLALPVPAFATLLTFTVQGTVTSFIDVDNVYGFGAGANLAGLAVNDVYTIDTTANYPNPQHRQRTLRPWKHLSGVLPWIWLGHFDHRAVIRSRSMPPTGIASSNITPSLSLLCSPTINRFSNYR